MMVMWTLSLAVFIQLLTQGYFIETFISLENTDILFCCITRHTTPII